MSDASNPRIPSSFFETGLVLAQSAMKNAQHVVEKLTGRNPEPARGVPVNGPETVDAAVADFVDRFMRVYRYSPLGLSQLPAASGAMMAAARESFRNFDFKDPRNIALPFNLALSFGTLMTESALRGLATLDVVGPRRVSRLVTDFFEMFTEIPIYLTLEYGELIEKCRDRLNAEPGDYRTRMELARILAKCGRYADAAVEFRGVPRGASQYATAMHEAATALYRAGRYSDAVQTEVDSLDASPGDARPRMVLFQAAQKLGGYPEYVPEDYRIRVKAGFAGTNLAFEDIAARIGIDKTSGGRGTAVFDYDNDGYLDLLITSAFGGSNLYHNNGDGTFTDVSVKSGIDAAINSFSVSVGDYDNDGNVDVYINRLGWYPGEGSLYRNNGDGTFTDVTREAGVDAWGPCFSASWIDYDNDGFLDLFVPNNLGGLAARKAPNRLLHNNGDGTFTDVTEKSGLETIWPTICGAWGDYDNDGLMDLFLSNGIGRSQLFHNNGNGTFTDVSRNAGVDVMGFGGPAFWWDYDNDGWMDIGQYVWSDHDDVIYTMVHGEGPKGGQHMRVYHNNRDGTFRLVSDELNLNECWGTMSGSFGDVNNDGNLDLILGNGSPKLDRFDPLVILESDGRKFRNTTFSAGLPFTGKSHGANVADLFGDGRLSIIVASGGAYPGDLLASSVYCPRTLPGNYLNVRLVGVRSNRSAIGARVSIEAGGLRQVREISGGTNFGCMPFEQHFGLGDRTGVDSLEIRWPSGLRQTFPALPCNRTLEFTETMETWKDVYGKP